MPLLNVVSNEQLDAEAARVAIVEEEASEYSAETLEGIAGHITKAWEAARTAKQTLARDRILDAQRSRKGEYSLAKLTAIRKVSGGSEEFGRVVSNKCRIAEAWLRDVYLGQVEPAWVLNNTPVPSLSPDDQKEVEDTLQQELLDAVATFGEAPTVQMTQSRKNELLDGIRMRAKEQARLAVERMSDKMADQMQQTGFHKEWAEFLNDYVTYPAAHIKGPIYRRQTKLEWKDVDGKFKPVPVESIVPMFERVDPLRAYPAPGSVGPQDGYWIEHISMQEGELYDLIGVEGFNEVEIRLVLEEAKDGGIVNWLGLTDAAQADADRGDLPYLSPHVDIDAIEYYGPVNGQQLLDWGVPKDEVDDADASYEVTAWLIGRHVIKVQLNPNPLGTRPVYKACWEEIPGEYWGQGLPDGLRDVEGITNAAIRALVNNMGIASGPQTEVNVDRLPPGEDIESMYPWKIWQTQDSQFSSTSPAVSFFQPDMNSAELISVLDKFYQYADDWSLIPRYMGGSDSISGGIGRTASGMSMLFNAANKGLKGVVSNVDNNVLTPMLTALYTYNMMFEEDESIKGDAQVEARGAVALMQIETLQLRRNEFLQATANDIDSQIVGVEGRAEILREVAKGLEMDVNRIIPPRSQVPPGQPAAQGAGGQAAISAPNQDQLATGAAVTNNFGNNNLRST
ncbi:MAG: hypothetical protein BMS9Abin11_1758 [Gammaproteobacteria bacterium]|nr:MAG: hypothetical protein BMS9Abin11_1758 [Gammaproteobacteria bacterium]